MSRLARRAGLLALLLPWYGSATGCRSAPVVTTPIDLLIPRIPRDAARFEIEMVDDSTATIRYAEARWIKPGAVAYAVDPARRDALVAKLRIIGRDSATARALVTSQVARVSTDHFLLITRPPTPWWKSGRFWTGALLGGAAGVGATVAIR